MLSALALLLVQKSKESSERKMERESGIIELCMREKYFMVENLFSLGEVSSQQHARQNGTPHFVKKTTENPTWLLTITKFTLTVETLKLKLFSCSCN